MSNSIVRSNLVKGERKYGKLLDRNINVCSEHTFKNNEEEVSVILISNSFTSLYSKMTLVVT